MFSKSNEFPDDFILDITKIPGSSDDVALKAIKYYSDKLENPNLPQSLKDIASAYVNNLTEYYQMSNLNSQSLRGVLPHLSESARFMENNSSTDIDIESAGRIKSFYSAYQKILDKVIECISQDKPIPQTGLLKDIYATRDILHPRHDMKLNPQAFYKLTYKIILTYMKYIDTLNAKDNRYRLVVVPEGTRSYIEKPKQYTYPPNNTICIPEKDFIDYSLENEGIPHGYRYLADLSDYISLPILFSEILKLKNCDISSKTDFSNSAIYTLLLQQSQRDLQFELRYLFDSILLKKLDENLLNDYHSMPIHEFLAKHQTKLNSFQIDSCEFIKYIDFYTSENKSLNLADFPKFSNPDFIEILTQTLNKISDSQHQIIMEKLQEIQALDLSNISENLNKASKIKYYSLCCKDYMKNPKSTGYQSFHIRVTTPFGIYEKQIRTESQDKFAERGHASHSLSYKPDIKNSFHRLKVPTFFSPKRNTNGDIITPTELGVLPFDASVNVYYGTPFSTFSEGKTFEQFKSQFSTKEDFDQALLELSPTDDNFITKLMNKFFKKTNFAPRNSSENIDVPLFKTVPKDIAVYSSGASTDDSDPHANR